MEAGLEAGLGLGLGLWLWLWLGGRPPTSRHARMWLNATAAERGCSRGVPCAPLPLVSAAQLCVRTQLPPYTLSPYTALTRFHPPPPPPPPPPSCASIFRRRATDRLRLITKIGRSGQSAALRVLLGAPRERCVEA